MDSLPNAQQVVRLLRTSLKRRMVILSLSILSSAVDAAGLGLLALAAGRRHAANQRKRSRVATAVLAALFGVVVTFAAPSEAVANLLVNGDFEVPEAIDGNLPTSFGDWAHDTAAIVTSEAGILPFSGSQMLKFIATSPTGAGGSSGSEVIQLIDVAGFAVGTPFRGSGYVNRVSGDSQTDTLFSLFLQAYSGSPADFPSVVNNPIDSKQVFLFSDGDESTWERLETETLFLPAGADYLEFRFNASEDVFNDGSLPEFDGHYGDAASVLAVPEPSTLCFAAIGLLGLATRRRNDR